MQEFQPYRVNNCPEIAILLRQSRLSEVSELYMNIFLIPSFIEICRKKFSTVLDSHLFQNLLKKLRHLAYAGIKTFCETVFNIRTKITTNILKNFGKDVTGYCRNSLILLGSITSRCSAEIEPIILSAFSPHYATVLILTHVRVG